MAKIFKMSQHMADLIAAGEVVERPASVVKELIENSVDAGAKAVTIEIKNGGMTYIRISDDGCGIAPEDMETAFFRHATSKLRTEEELGAIKTLGFRGEALAAIAAVSRVEMFTRERGAAEGTYIGLEGGQVKERSPAGCPEGTTIIVRDLFFNTPARLRFMKKDSSEGAAVSSAVIRCALSRPNLSVHYIKDEREELHTPGDGRIDSCIYSVLGREFSASMLKAKAEDSAVSVEGYVSSPNGARGNRSHQFFFVNGRHIKSQMLQAALEQAYKNSLFGGRFPACVLYLTVNPASIDVNVHPAKTEIKFLGEKQVFDAVYYAVKSALAAESEQPKIKIAPAPEKRALPPQSVAGKAPFISSAPQGRPPQAIYNQDINFKTSVIPADDKAVISKPAVEQTKIEYRTARAETEKTSPEPCVDTPYRIIGETMNSYIIVERGESLYLIDKHAAHERILFEKLKGDGKKTMSQTLITPYIAEVGREEAAELLSHRELLNEIGFEIEDFGGGAVAVNSLPADLDASEIPALLTEIFEDIRLGKRPNSLGVRDEILAGISCRAAIKAGQRSEPEEYAAIVEKVMSGVVKYCPHGRPVSMEITKKALDKNFRRI